MAKKRPVNLQLTTLKFPSPAIASILHRASGFILFLFIPFLLWALRYSLSSAEDFNGLQQCCESGVGKFIVWIFLSALLYHLIAGVRHLIMDMGFAESLKAGRASARIVFILAGLGAIFIGIWLW